MIKTIIFDIDNTMYSYDDAHAVAFARLLEYVQQELGLSREEFMSIHNEMYSELIDYMGDCAAIHNRMIRYVNILERLGKPLYPHAMKMYRIYWDTLLDNMTVSEGLLDAMKELKQRGIRIGIGTDMTAVIQIEKLERMNALRYVDFIVSSEEAGAEKPAGRMMDRCLEKAGCERSECAFVGDNPKKDCRGAVDAGMKAILYSPGGGDAADGVVVLESFRDLISILEL